MILSLHYMYFLAYTLYKGRFAPNVRLNLKSPVKGGFAREPWFPAYWIAITRGTIKGFPTVF